MFENRSEANERVLTAVEDIKSCCEVSDYYMEWSDVAVSSIQAFLEDLTLEQLDDTCGAFREYITETAKEDENLAGGVKEALTICLKEMLDYIEEAPEADDDITINDLMQEFVSGKGVNIRDIIKTSEKNGGIDFVSADIGLASAEFYLAPIMARGTILKQLLMQVADDYDYVVIDCQASLGILVLNALTAADGVIIPAQTQEFSKRLLKLL